MDTSFLSVEKLFDGVQLTATLSKGRLSRKDRALSFTLVKTVNKWLRDPKNRSIILTLLSQLEGRGIEIGMNTAAVASYQAMDYGYYASHAIELKRLLRTL